VADRTVSRRQVLAAGAALPVSLALGRMGAAKASGASTNPADLSIVELLPLLERRELSARELVEACIARVERLEPTIKAFQRKTFDVAMAQAKEVDDARALGRPVGRLAGVPSG
jgi:hypothetical protein